MTKKGIISINDARAITDATGSLTAAVDTSQIYQGKFKSIARKKEVNVRVLSNENNNYMLRHFPLLDKDDIAEIRSMDSSFKYIHFGCITVSIEPLMHTLFLKKYGKNIMGLCVIMDTMFNQFEQSIISLHKFDLSCERADFICMPNHCLSITDEHLTKRISIMLLVDKIDVRPGCDLFNVCVGSINTCTNTLNPTDVEMRVRSIPIRGSEEVEFKAVEASLASAFGNSESESDFGFMQDGKEVTIMRPQSVLSRIGWKKPPRRVIRKNYVTSEKGEDSMLKLPKLTRTLSAPRRSFKIDEPSLERHPSKFRQSGDDVIKVVRNPIVIQDSDLKRLIREDREKMRASHGSSSMREARASSKASLLLE
ncbi:TPA_asm: P3 [Rubus alphacytorhabdovirus 1]|nr:TPA_asm: P3 [Rubus alphacytorhabdovirus 1]